jgi:hypothetical protein
MTSTKIINAQVLAAAGGNYLLAVRHTLAGATNSFNLEVEIINGAQPHQQSAREVELCFVTSNYLETASTFVVEADFGSFRKTSDLKTDRAARTFIRSDMAIAHGANLYVWLNAPTLSANATVNCWVNEF